MAVSEGWYAYEIGNLSIVDNAVKLRKSKYHGTLDINHICQV